jgi:hypothetical protein
MKVLPKAKQVRFAQLVKASGKPHAATLWTEPTKDPAFKKAMQEDRVVTVRNVNIGTKKDRGVIGFLKGPNATYLVFPKPLPMAEGTGVIGLKFDELAEEPVKDPVKVKEPVRKTKKEKVRTAKSSINSAQAKTKKEEPAEQEKTSLKFQVRVAFSATVLRDFEVEATGASEAIAAAEAKAKEEPPAKVDWKVEGLEVKKSSED